MICPFGKLKLPWQENDPMPQFCVIALVFPFLLTSCQDLQWTLGGPSLVVSRELTITGLVTAKYRSNH